MDRQSLNTAGIVAAVLVLAVGGPLLVRELRSLPDAGSLAARAEEKIVTLEVRGVAGAAAARAVRSRLEALAGVSAADVRVEQERAYVVCDRALPDSALLGAIEAAAPGVAARVVQK